MNDRSDTEIPQAEDLDYQEIANVLHGLRERYLEEGDEMAYPADWWNKEIRTLANRVETRAKLEWLEDE